jgi:DNA-binding NarL/FixJ family response regulator
MVLHLFLNPLLISINDMNLTRNTNANEHLDSPNEFTRREFNILKLASEGHTNRQIGSILFISEKTVKCHRQNIMQKVGIKGKSEMMKFLMKINVENNTKSA